MLGDGEGNRATGVVRAVKDDLLVVDVDWDTWRAGAVAPRTPRFGPQPPIVMDFRTGTVVVGGASNRKEDDLVVELTDEVKERAVRHEPVPSNIEVA
jgi:hypothetical protein